MKNKNDWGQSTTSITKIKTIQIQRKHSLKDRLNMHTFGFLKKSFTNS